MATNILVQMKAKEGLRLRTILLVNCFKNTFHTYILRNHQNILNLSIFERKESNRKKFRLLSLT